MKKAMLDLPNPLPIKLTKPRLSEAERQLLKRTKTDMTLCIAAIARREKRIVAACDHMVTLEGLLMTVEACTTSKITRIGGARRWISLFAGDISTATKINAAASASLGKTVPTAQQVEGAYRREFDTALKEKAEDTILRPYGMSRAQFLKNGRKVFGPPEFSAMMRRMDKIRLGTEFLIGGFDKKGDSHLFSVTDQSRYLSHEQVGFCAMGTGIVLATASLLANFEYADSLAEVVYRVAEAKFRGEPAPGVGPTTTMCVLDGDGNLQVLFDPYTQALRDLWKTQSGVPPTLEKTVDTLLNRIPSVM